MWMSIHTVGVASKGGIASAVIWKGPDQQYVACEVGFRVLVRLEEGVEIAAIPRPVPLGVPAARYEVSFSRSTTSR